MALGAETADMTETANTMRNRNLLAERVASGSGAVGFLINTIDNEQLRLLNNQTGMGSRLIRRKLMPQVDLPSFIASTDTAIYYVGALLNDAANLVDQEPEIACSAQLKIMTAVFNSDKARVSNMNTSVQAVPPIGSVLLKRLIADGNSDLVLASRVLPQVKDPKHIESMAMQLVSQSRLVRTLIAPLDTYFDGTNQKQSIARLELFIGLMEHLVTRLQPRSEAKLQLYEEVNKTGNYIRDFNFTGAESYSSRLHNIGIELAM